MCVKRSSYARETVQVVNFIDVLYTLHSHFNHESTDFTGYRKRVNFMPAYLHVLTVILNSLRKGKNEGKEFSWKKLTFTIFIFFFFFFFPKIFVPNLSINFSKLNFKFVDKCR